MDKPDRPLTRQEFYLDNISGGDSELPLPDRTREEMYLHAIADHTGGMEDDIAELQEKVRAMATDMKYKGSVEDYAHLPTDAQRGDVYTTRNNGKEYVFDGEVWVEIGSGGSGGGDVTSVNGKTGDVVLIADDIEVKNSQSIQDNLERIDDELGDLYDAQEAMAPVIIYAESHTTKDTYVVPVLTDAQITNAYNAVVAGKEVVIVDDLDTISIKVTDASNIDGIAIRLLFTDKLILTYKLGGEIVSARIGGGGGGGTWGSITGTLSDQTDLQAALDAKQNVVTVSNHVLYV